MVSFFKENSPLISQSEVTLASFRPFLESDLVQNVMARLGTEGWSEISLPVVISALVLHPRQPMHLPLSLLAIFVPNIAPTINLLSQRKNKKLMIMFNCKFGCK